MYRCIIFDFDGTLADTKKGIINAARFALAKFGIHSDDQALMRFIGPSLWDSFKNFYGFDAADQARAVDFYRQYYFTKGMYESAVYPGIRTLLTAIKEQQYKTAVASAKLESSVTQTLRYHGIGLMFDTVTGSTYDGSYSDKAEMIADVLKFFGIQNPKQAVYIGDSITDYIGAKKAGTDFIAALYDRSPDEFLSADILMPAYEVNDIYGYLKL